MDIITSSTEITAMFSHGRHIRTPYVTLIMSEEHDRLPMPGGRVAFIAGKRNGNSVWRNSAKRRMRAICRDLNGPWEGQDVIFLAMPKILSASYQEVRDSCRKALAGCEK